VQWSDVLKAALSLFLVLTGLGLAYLFLRMAGVFGRLGSSVTRVTDEVVPILNKAQTTMDGVNREIDRVDEIMVTAVNGAKGAERTIQTISSAATAPVRILSGVAAGVKEGLATFVARRAADAQQAASETNAPEREEAAAGAATAAAGDAEAGT
jgi:CTP synthase (UTP-ammonia lyase)